MVTLFGLCKLSMDLSCFSGTDFVFSAKYLIKSSANLALVMIYALACHTHSHSSNTFILLHPRSVCFLVRSPCLFSCDPVLFGQIPTSHDEWWVNRMTAENHLCVGTIPPLCRLQQVKTSKNVNISQLSGRKWGCAVHFSNLHHRIWSH